MSTISLQVASNRIVRRAGLVGSGIDTDLNPSKQAIGDIVTKEHELWERIIGSASSNNGPHILSIRSDGLGIGVVGISTLDSRSKLLIPEQLADV
jgi:hypothetical protein